MAERDAIDRIPDADVQYPTCGACLGETEYDDGDFHCESCKLGFNGRDLSAFYWDNEDETCGEECDNYYHGANRINVGYGYECTSCVLPTDHSSGHFTACKPVVLKSGDSERSEQ